jgi:hypothetical protein
MYQSDRSKLKGSWVDFLTNDAFIKNPNPRSLSNIFIGYKYPSSIFWSLIHEATHHFCFTSYLGNTLYFLRVRTIENITIEDIQNDKKNDLNEDLNKSWDIYSDNVRYKVAKQIFEPLNEGLALFAEYDIYPTPTEAIPPYLVYLCGAYSGLTWNDFYKDIKDGESKYSELLVNLRFSTQGINKKAELLVNTFLPQKSPYLCGYLFVKNIQLALISKNYKFRDPNLFLQFIRQYFYNDLGFISILLDTSTLDEKIAPKLINYFMERVEILIGELSPDFIDEFEQNIITRDPVKRAECDNILTKSEFKKQGQERMDKLLKEMLDVEEKPIAYLRFYMRQYFKVTQVDGHISIKDKHTVVSVVLSDMQLANLNIRKLIETGWLRNNDGKYIFTIMSIPNEGDFTPFEGYVKIEHHVSFFANAFCTTFVSDGILKFHSFSKNWDAVDKEQFLIFFTSGLSEHDTTLSHDIDELIDKALSKESKYFKIIDDLTNENCFPQLYNWYIKIALLNSPENNLDDLKNKMAENGFWEVVENNEDVLNLLSFISLLISNRSIEYSLLVSALQSQNTDPKLCDLLIQYLRKNNFNVVNTIDDTIHCVGI